MPPGISQELYGEIESCTAAANSSLPLPPERLASVALGGKLTLLSGDFTQLLAICGGRAIDAEVFHDSSLRWLLRWTRLTVVVSSVPFRCPDPAFFVWARRFGVGALYDERGRALAAELPGKKLHFADRAAWEVALPSLLQSLFRLSGLAVLVSAASAQGRSPALATVRAAAELAEAVYLAPHVRTVARVNRAALAPLPGETRESLSFTEEVYARGPPSTSADGAGRTLPISFGDPARAALAASHISGSPPGVFAVQRGATVCVTGVHWDTRLRNGAAGVVAAVEDECVRVQMFADLLPSSTSAPPPVSFFRVSVVTETSTREHPDLSRELRRFRFPLSFCFAETADASAGRTTSRTIFDLLDPTFSHGRDLVAMPRTRLAASLVTRLRTGQTSILNPLNSIIFPRDPGSRATSPLFSLLALARSPAWLGSNDAAAAPSPSTGAGNRRRPQDLA